MLTSPYCKSAKTPLPSDQSFFSPMEKLVELPHQEVRIDFLLGCKCRANIRLRSLSSTTPIAFKIQTSSPHKFLVNPPAGLIPPLSYATFQVILKPQSQLPPSFPRSPADRFLIKTSLAPELTCNSPESLHSWFNSMPHRSTHDLKLKVAFVGPFLLRQAVTAGHLEAVKNIIKRQRTVVAELATREAELLFRVASELGSNSEEMVNLLIEAGLKVERHAKLDGVRWAAEKGWTELNVAVVSDRMEEVERLITEGKCGSLDCRDKEGRTPLHLAASKGHLGCAKVLVGAGADVDAVSKDGRTALYRAAANGDRSMVKFLIEMDADPTLTTMDRGRYAIDIARDKGHKEVVQLLERGEAVLNAARRGELKRLELLLEKEASMSYQDQYGLTALHVAAIKGHKDVVMLLAEFGVSLECQDAEGYTALHLAVEGGCAETVEVLINRGANVNAKSKKGATPLSIARAMEYQDISELLQRRGADSLVSSSSSPSSSSLL